MDQHNKQPINENNGSGDQENLDHPKTPAELLAEFPTIRRMIVDDGSVHQLLNRMNQNYNEMKTKNDEILKCSQGIIEIQAQLSTLNEAIKENVDEHQYLILMEENDLKERIESSEGDVGSLKLSIDEFKENCKFISGGYFKEISDAQDVIKNEIADLTKASDENKKSITVLDLENKKFVDEAKEVIKDDENLKNKKDRDLALNQRLVKHIVYQQNLSTIESCQTMANNQKDSIKSLRDGLLTGGQMNTVLADNLEADPTYQGHLKSITNSEIGIKDISAKISSMKSKPRNDSSRKLLLEIALKEDRTYQQIKKNLKEKDNVMLQHKMIFETRKTEFNMMKSRQEMFFHQCDVISGLSHELNR